MGYWIPDEAKGAGSGEGPTIAGWIPSRMKRISMLGSGLAWCFRNQVSCGGCPHTLALTQDEECIHAGVGAGTGSRARRLVTYRELTNKVNNNGVRFLIIGEGC